MKIRFAALSALLPLVLNAQLTPTSVDNATTGLAPYQVVAVGPHERTWQSVSVDAAGTTNVHTFVELTTGLNYFNPDTGRWEESQPQFEILPTGYAVARKTQHQVIAAGNLNTLVALELLSPDNQRFQCHVVGLSYYDPVSGKSVLIAGVKDSIGELVAPNQIIYPDAFTDFLADYRITLTKAELEADVILRQQPPSPADYGLPPETTHLEVLTEYVLAPTPVQQVATSLPETNSPPDTIVIGPNNLTDERLSFGLMSFGQGRAFSVDADGINIRNLNEYEVPVGKSWTTLEGRQFLIESVNYLSIRPQLALLPAAPAVQAALRGSKPSRWATNTRTLPKAPKARTSRKAVRMAKAEVKPRPGFVLDWVLLNSTANQTLKCDTTYYVSGTVVLSGVSTIEGGTVVKYTNGAQLKIQGTLNCLTAPYRPAIFTSKDDNTVGEAITGSTGSPTNYYAATALYFDDNQSDLRYVRISYATQALYYDYDTGYPHRLSHAQIVHCQQGIVPLNTTFNLRNVLMYDVQTNFYASSYYATGIVEHLTADVAGVLNGSSSIYLYLTNSLLVSVTNVGTISGGYNATNTTGTGVFQTVGAGAHYLADNTYRNAGTTNISYQTLTDLQRLTTYPPLVLTNAITVATTLSPQAQRDTDTPDLGYHYYPIDYAINSLQVTNATLTLTNGVALASYGSTGLWLTDGAQLFSEGTPLNRNHLTRFVNVQELSTNWGGASSVVTINPYNYGVAPPSAQIRFTDFDGLSSCGYHLYTANTNWVFASLLLQDCSFNGGSVYLDGYNTSTLSVNNNLFERVEGQFWDSPQLTFYNNLYRYGSIWTLNSGPNTWVFNDNAFDSTTLEEYGTALTTANNAYVNMGTNRFYPTNSFDKILTSFTYTNGPLGNYYQVSTNLYDAGSRNAANAGLYHYTVRLDQTKETNSTVDIGLHYAAVNPAEVELAKSNMTATATSSYDTTWVPSKAIDGVLSDPGWHNQASGWTEEPAWLRIDLGSSQTISHVGYISRDGTANNFNGGGSNGAYQQYKIYVTDSGSTNVVDWGTDVANGQWLWPNGKERRDVTFNPKTGRYVIYRRITASGYGTPPGYANANEVWIYKRNSMFSQAIDTDGDGLPDYFEDRNGNGTVDTGETDWQNSNGGMSGASALQVFTPLK